MQRERGEYDTPDPLTLADFSAWLAAQAAAFEDAAAAPGARHAAVFRLAYGLLAAGEERRAFTEFFLPWYNGLEAHRAEAQFATLGSYLALIGEVGEGAAVGMARAYLRAVLARAATLE